MSSADQAHHALQKLFEKDPIADLVALFRALKTTSRMTVFRRLSSLGYVSSCSHSGRYYTLASVPAFDADGLWRHRGVCFSREGTLKATVFRLVENSVAGQLHRELQQRLQLRVHNTLAELVAEHRLGRRQLGAEHLYVSAVAARGAEQLLRRQASIAQTVSRGDDTAGPFEPATVIAVLAEVIHGAALQIDEPAIATRLGSRGVTVTAAQVGEILRIAGVEKKTVPFPSSRWQR